MPAEPAKAKDAAIAQVIQISYNQINGYGFSPSNCTVPNAGTVDFTNSRTCWVWTFAGGVLVNAFNGEQNDHVLASAPVSSFSVSTQYNNTVLTLVGTDVNAAPPPAPANSSDILKGTIHVGSSMEHHEKH